jgi:hypothetical protein
VEKFLRKQLKYEGSIFLFCGSGFSPTPDQLLQDLYQVLDFSLLLSLLQLKAYSASKVAESLSFIMAIKRLGDDFVSSTIVTRFATGH